MKNKVILLAMTCLAMITTAWGQVESFSDRDLEAEQYIFAIQKVWTDNPIRVENIDPNTCIRSFAKAFCSRYQDYRPNEAMMDYLKNPETTLGKKSTIIRKTSLAMAISNAIWVDSSTT